MGQRADFNKVTFLERVSLAAREPVYSAAFAWALDDRSPLPLGQRLTIVAALSGADTTGGRSISANTEWNKIDLLLSVEREAGQVHVAIENKIKAAEGEQQLAAHDQRLRQLAGEVKKVFLTLTGELPRSGTGWKPVSYSALRDTLSAPPASGSQPFNDLCDALTRLAAVAAEARANPRLAAAAFEDGDAPAVTEISSSDVTSYVEEMRLEKVVQCIWMAELAARLGIVPPWQVAIGETHRQALMNVQASLQDRPGYAVGVQLQWRSLKAFCQPFPYPKKASEDQHQMVEGILQTIRSALSLGDDVKASQRGKRGFRSYSVVNLPRERNFNEWADILKPWLERVYSALPSVTPVIPSAIPIDEEE